MTELTITPNLAKKTAKFAGAVAAGEHVAVTLKYGASIADTANLRLRVVGPCGTLAIFPQPETEDAWEVDGEDLACTLNLNTVQMLKAVAPAIEIELLVVLDDAELHTLYFKDTCAFKHWPMRRGDETPYDLDEFPGLIEEWREELDNIAASVEKDGKVATISITNKDGTTTTAEVRDGEDGQDGRDGTDGVGIPEGGTTGQMLVKASDDDYDLEWKTGGAGGLQPDWNDTNPASPAFIKNKPTAFTPSSHAATHAAGGSDAIAPSDIGALPSSAEDIDGYVMSFSGAQYALQTPYTQSGISGWGTADGTWKLFVAADGTVLLLKDGVAKPTNPLSVAGIPLPWSLQFNDEGLVTAVVASAGATSTEEIVGHLRSRENPHGVTAAQIGAATVDDLPTALSQLSDDATHRTVTDAEKTAWNGKQNALTFDNAPTAGSTNPVTSGGVKSALDGKLNTSGGTITGTLNIGENVLSFSGSGDVIEQYAELNGSGVVFNRNGGGARIVLPLLSETGIVALTSDLPYSLLATPSSGTPTANTRHVLKVTATTAQSVTLPTIPATDEVLNCDIVVDGTAATADFGLTLVGGTGVSVYYPDGTGITCKSGCVTMVSCVGINGLGWLVAGCNNLKTAS